MKKSQTLYSPEDTSAIKEQILQVFDKVMSHSGFGRIEIDIRWQKKNKKEVILAWTKEKRLLCSGESSEKGEKSIVPA
jgi:hypothetical protein